MATGCGSISTIFSGILLLCVSSIIIIIIKIIIKNNNKNNNNNFPKTRKYWVDVQWGIVSSHGERDPL